MTETRRSGLKRLISTSYFMIATSIDLIINLARAPFTGKVGHEIDLQITTWLLITPTDFHFETATDSAALQDKFDPVYHSKNSFKNVIRLIKTSC